MRGVNRLLCGLVCFGAACVDLDVVNPNSPERARALAVPEDVAVLARSSVYEWWQASTHYQPYIMLETTADATTGNCCWVRFDNEEPRRPYNNHPNGGDELTARRPWDLNYRAITSAVDALRAMDDGVVFTDDPVENERMRAAALFALAAAHSNLAMVFDSAFVITQPVSASALPRLRGYREVREAALALWEEVIVLTDGKTWAWDETTLPLAGGAPTAERLHRIARTLAARTLVLTARTAADNTQTDWARVLELADGGVTGTGVADMDFAIVDDYNTWWDYIKNYGAWSERFRVDQRLINRMAANIPVRFAGLASQPVPEPDDDRLGIAALPCSVPDPLSCTAGNTEDFVYLGTVVGDPGRGLWMQSPFWHRRYVLSSFEVPGSVNIGQPLPHVLAAENDLMIAEALARTGGDLVRAAGLVNKTHVGRGGRTPVAALQGAVLAGVNYERDVELLNTGGIALFDRRRVDGLQLGTLRHLPVPGRELEALGKPLYTYGGVGQPDM
jgi:hypothetical protein